jgi:hypothetical protein
MQRAGRSLLSLLLTVALAAACWLGARALGARAVATRQTWPEGEGLVWLPPPQAAPVLAMGYRQLWADIDWARMLVYYGTNWREDVKFRFRYLMRFLDNIIALDPKFKRVYEWGSYAVTFQGGKVEPEEYELSVRYLERGIQEYPDHWRYYWLAGIRYYIDLTSDDPTEERRLRERGAALIEQAMHKPDAPDNLALLAAGLRTELGQKERALENLRQVILTTDDPEGQEKLIQTYKHLAGQEFPEEAMQAKAELQRRWFAELPFASPHLYVILGDRPSQAIDLDALALQGSVFGSLMEDLPAGQEPAEEPAEEPTERPADHEPPVAAEDEGKAAPPARSTEVQNPAQRGAAATPVP